MDNAWLASARAETLNTPGSCSPAILYKFGIIRSRPWEAELCIRDRYRLRHDRNDRTQLRNQTAQNQEYRAGCKCHAVDYLSLIHISYDSGSYASSTTYLTGKATERCALRLREQICKLGAELLEMCIRDRNESSQYFCTKKRCDAAGNRTAGLRG